MKLLGLKFESTKTSTEALYILNLVEVLKYTAPQFKVSDNTYGEVHSTHPGVNVFQYSNKMVAMFI